MSENPFRFVMAIVAAVGGVAAVLTLLMAVFGGIFVDEVELMEGLKATGDELKVELKATEDELKVEMKASEDRLMGAIRHSTEQTNAQMQELRGYIVNHFDGHPNDGHPNDGDPTN